MDHVANNDAALVTASVSWRDGLPNLTWELRRAVPGGKRVLLHGGAVSSNDPSDIDLAIIVQNGTDRFEAVRKMMGVLADRSIATGILHTCFPIEEAACTSATSQYIQNVLANGSDL